jgi:ElaB/YqjD/DUF883 family membrane-anchored ribosome-binding protein
MNIKQAQQTPRTVDISESEKNAANLSLSLFKEFLRDLNAAQEHDETLNDILKKSENITTEQLYDIRHLLIRFQGEVRENYNRIIPKFGKAIESLKPLLSDTETAQIKDSLVDTMQRLTDVVEEYMESFDNFSQDQIKKITQLSAKSSQLITGIRSIIDHQLRDHFKKDILRKKSFKELKLNIKKRARLIKIFGDLNGVY